MNYLIKTAKISQIWKDHQEKNADCLRTNPFGGGTAHTLAGPHLHDLGNPTRMVPVRQRAGETD